MVQLHDNFFLPSGISFTYIHVSKMSKAKTLSPRNTAEHEQNHTRAGAFIVLSSFRGIFTILSNMYNGTFFENITAFYHYFHKTPKYISTYVCTESDERHESMQE